MSELQPLSCSNCAAPLTDDDDTDDIITCEYCGQVHKYASAPQVEPEPAESGGFTFQPGDLVAVKWGSKWWDATVREVLGADSWRIHYDGWGSKWDEVVDRSRIVPRNTPEPDTVDGGRYALSEAVTARQQSYQVGAKVAVKWKRKWYDATILAVEGAGRYRIHYDGWSSSWDETVGPSRIAERGSVSIARKGCGWAMTTLGVLAMVAVGLLVGLGIVVSVCGDSPTVDANGPPVTAETVLGPGDKVHAQWGSSWYMATVLAVAADGTVQVHYDGFDDSSDEYVPRDRLRLIPPAAGP